MTKGTESGFTGVGKDEKPVQEVFIGIRGIDYPGDGRGYLRDNDAHIPNNIQHTDGFYLRSNSSAHFVSRKDEKIIIPPNFCAR